MAKRRYASVRAIDQVTAETARRFPCFGKTSRSEDGNPISAALANDQPSFALGVDVREVVEFVAKALYAAKRRNKPGA